MKIKTESGIALVSTLLVLVLLSALLITFTVSVNSDQENISIDRDQTRAFYGAQAGLEKLTADLGTLFDINYAPTAAQINALATSPPSISGISFLSPDGSSGYRITPSAVTMSTISGGAYEGLVGMITPYTMAATARTASKAEVRLSRTLQTVAVPVFQFGIFSETDLSFFAGPDFNFGGRVHTNGNLFLAEGDGKTLKLSDRATAVGEIIRTNLSNGWPVTSSYNGTVSAIRAPGTYRSLARTEGSLVGTLGSAQNEPTWTNLSIGTYNGNIRNGRTGSTTLSLPLVSQGAAPIDLIRRPAQNSAENTANPEVYKQRHFRLASLRILLSDSAAEITSLPSVTATAPVQLVGTAPGTATLYATAGTYANSYRIAQNLPIITGYIKIEVQTAQDVWQDVTTEILSLGIAGRDMTTTGSRCANQPNAVIRLQRFKDAVTTACANSGTNYWPNVLYDAREGYYRDGISANTNTIFLSGVMHYVELDVANLVRWFTGAIGSSGTSALAATTGYEVYFSDRRTNKNASGVETGEYGFEDIVNPESSTGTPNGILNEGEDVNGNGALDTYGGTPVIDASATPQSPLVTGATPRTTATATIARVNRPIFFRRALMLVNGQSVALGNNSDGNRIGLTISTENPLYVKGNFNAAGTFSGSSAPCALIADSVTLLSSNWNDAASFNSPSNDNGRAATTTWYRTAIIAGKGRSFNHYSGTLASNYQDYGTDGGVHNFLRFLEDWDGQTLNYRGSIVSLYYNHQAVGTYKCGSGNVYDPPSRGYNFDTNFLTPALLPPNTPMFRDINITGFSRLIMPNQ